MLVRVSPLGLLPLLGACFGEGDGDPPVASAPDTTAADTGATDDGDDTATTDETDTTDETGCDATDTCPLDPYFFLVEGFFAYDADRGEVVTATLAGAPMPPTVTITFFDLGAFEEISHGEYCVLTLTYTGTDPLPLVPYSVEYDEESLSLLGFELPDTDVTVDGCENLDPAALGTAAEIAAQGWGLSVGSVTADATRIYGDDGMFDDDYIGGGFRWGGLDPAIEWIDGDVLPFEVAVAYPLDADHAVLDRAGDVATTDAVEAREIDWIDGETMRSDTLPTGLYSVHAYSGLFP